MDYFRSEEEFHKQLNRLNALGNPYFSWSTTQARKDHIDEFGDNIDTNDMYYKRSLGGSFDNVIKLSRDSMEKLLYCVFSGGGALEALGDLALERQEQQMRDALETMNKFDDQ